MLRKNRCNRTMFCYNFNKNVEMSDNSLDVRSMVYSGSTNSHIRETLLNFIENYRELRVLWDVSSKEYSNKDKKNEAYDKLLEIYKRIKRNATREDVKKKINSLRTNFRKEFKKVEASKRSGVGANEVYEPKCWIFKELSFLIESSSSYVIPSVSENQEIGKVGNDDSDEYGESEVIAQSSIDIPTSKKFKKLKRIESSHTERQNELINIVCEYLKKGDGEEDAVAKSWTCKLARMNPVQRIWAQKFVNDILTEGELGTLHRHSVCINQHQMQYFPSAPSPASSTSTSSSTVMI